MRYKCAKDIVYVPAANIGGWPFSVSRCPVPVNLIMAYGITVLPTAIAGVALYGVDHSIFYLFHDAHMVGKAVLGAGTSLVVIAIGNPPLLLSS